MVETQDRPARPRWVRWIAWGLGTLGALCAGAALAVALAVTIAWPNLPDIDRLTDYRPRLPMRVFSADGVLLGEFGEERRQFTPVAQMPALLRHAVIATEDASFYQHRGVDYRGVLRAGLANLRKSRGQGASTITMQVARNFYLPTRKTFTRKLYEMLLAFKIERQLSKDQILEIYLNQIYLGQRAYGFASASDIYFGKPLHALSLGEIAMLAGLPQAPITANPIVNPARATRRQQHVLDRLLRNGFIDAEQHAGARAELLRFRAPHEVTVHAEHAVETARQIVFAHFGPRAYDNGLDVHLTIDATDQAVAYRALRDALIAHERHQPWRGPEGHVMLPADMQALDAAVADALAEHPDSDELLAAVVLDTGAQPRAMLRTGEVIEVEGLGTLPARRGAVVRVTRGAGDSWSLTQLPEAEGAFVALDPHSGALRAMVGGFDPVRGGFNHATQAWRQSGSTLKPFLVALALERGFTPATLVNDAPLTFDAGDGTLWEPRNADGRFDGPITLRTALAASKNSVSVRLLQALGTQDARAWLTRFGFEAERQPANLTLALGSGATTPLQLAGAYAVLANGGHAVAPMLIRRITDADGMLLYEAPLQRVDESMRVIDARNAFLTGTLLQEVVRSGTARSAHRALQRDDLHGKTGTTNAAVDAWFAGYHPSLVAVAWVGHETPRSLGDRATGGRIALPMWVDFMAHALEGVAETEATPPAGLVQLDGEWYYEEFTPASGASRAGVDDEPPRGPTADERHRILDLFRR